MKDFNVFMRLSLPFTSWHFSQLSRIISICLCGCKQVALDHCTVNQHSTYYIVDFISCTIFFFCAFPCSFYACLFLYTSQNNTCSNKNPFPHHAYYPSPSMTLCNDIPGTWTFPHSVILLEFELVRKSVIQKCQCNKRDRRQLSAS